MKATSHSSPKAVAPECTDDVRRLRMALADTANQATWCFEQIDAMASAMLAYLESPDAYRWGPEKMAHLLDGIQSHAQTALNAIDLEVEQAGLQMPKDARQVAREAAWKVGSQGHDVAVGSAA